MTADLTDMTAPQPRKVTVTRYRCPFCRRQNSSKKTIAEHIARCWHNPATRGCRTCLHFERGRAVATYSAYEPPEALDAPDECAVGEELPENGFPVTDCPLWRDRDEDEDEPFVDAWDHGLRELDGDAR